MSDVRYVKQNPNILYILKLGLDNKIITPITQIPTNSINAKKTINKVIQSYVNMLLKKHGIEGQFRKQLRSRSNMMYLYHTTVDYTEHQSVGFTRGRNVSVSDPFFRLLKDIIMD